MLEFRVAGLRFQVETNGEEPGAGIRNYRPFRLTESSGETGRPLFRFSLDKKTEPPAGTPVKIFEYDLVYGKAVLHIYPESYFLSITMTDGSVYNADYPTAQSGEDDPEYIFRCDASYGVCLNKPYVLDHFLTLAFSLAASGYETLLIHASTIAYKGQAVMFLAESGTGKSTHTKLWRENIAGASLLNDDAPAVRITEGKITVYGTPWSGKLPCYKNEGFPLAACVRIRRAPYNKIERQDKTRAFGALLPSTMPSLQQEEAMLDKICETLSGILSSTPVYMLDCLPDRDAAMLSCSEIFGSMK